jgi:hypothetical protein
MNGYTNMTGCKQKLTVLAGSMGDLGQLGAEYTLSPLIWGQKKRLSYAAPKNYSRSVKKG